MIDRRPQRDIGPYQTQQQAADELAAATVGFPEDYMSPAESIVYCTLVRMGIQIGPFERDAIGDIVDRSLPDEVCQVIVGLIERAHRAGAAAHDLDQPDPARRSTLATAEAQVNEAGHEAYVRYACELLPAVRDLGVSPALLAEQARGMLPWLLVEPLADARPTLLALHERLMPALQQGAAGRRDAEEILVAMSDRLANVLVPERMG